MRRAIHIAAVLVCAGCFKPEPKEPIDFGRGTTAPGAETLPAPEPPPEGAWALAIESTEDGCGLAAPPDVVYLAGAGQDWQVALQPFFLDAAGTLAGDELVLNGTARVVYRPTLDCILQERDAWQLTRSAPETLTGEIARVRETHEGAECKQVLPADVELPCLTRWRVRLDHRSAKRAPSEPSAPSQ